MQHYTTERERKRECVYREGAVGAGATNDNPNDVQSISLSM